MRSRLLPVVAMAVVAATLQIACNAASTLQKGSSDQDLDAALAQQMSLHDALQVAPEDARPEIVDQLGPPDAFTVTMQEVEGQMVRQEEWAYFDEATRIDFVDGSLVWTVDIEPVPEGSLLASYYDPLAFQARMSLDEVRALLPGQDLAVVDLAEADMPGGVAVAGDQILLGFDQDQLVYVQTFALAPEATP
jgi:hypothetical protein